MANSIGTAYINIAPNMSGVQGKIAGGLRGSGSAFADQFGGEVSGKSAVIVGAIAGIAQAATSKALNILSNSISSAVKRVDTLNAAQKTFQYMGFAAEDSAAAVKAVTKSIQGLPTPLDSAIRGMTGLAATYGDVKLGQKVFTALNNAILGFGGSADMVDNAIQQLSQLPMDGPLDAQTWNSLRNSGITPVLVAMSKDMGKSVSQLKEELGNGTLTVKDFTDELLKLDTQGGGGLVSLQKIALNATSGIGTGFANMQTAVARGMANIIQAVGQKNISEAISKIGAGFEKVLNIVAKSIPVAIGYIKSFIDYLVRNKDVFLPLAAGATAAVGAFIALQIATKVAAGFTAITKAVKAAQLAMFTYSAITAQGASAMTAFNIATGANPIGLIVIAVAAAAAALAVFFTKTEAGRKIFENLKNAVMGVVNIFKLIATGDFKGGIFGLQEDSPVIGFFIKLHEVIKTVASFLGTAFSAAAKALGGPLKASFSAMVKIAQQLGDMLKPVVESMAKIGGQIGKALASVFKTIGEAIKPVVTAIGNFVSAMLKNKAVVNVLKAVGIAILAVIAAPIIAFVAAVVVGLTVLSKVLGFLANHFTVVKVILGVIFAPLIIAIAAAIISVKLIIAVVKTLINVFTTTFNIVKTVVTTAFSAIATVWNSVLKPVFSFIISVVKTILSIYIKVWAAIALVVVGTIAIIVQVIWAAMQGIWNVVTTVFNAIWQVVSTVFTAIWGVITTVMGAIFSVISAVWSAIWGVISSVIGFITAALVNAWNFYYGIISSVLSMIWGVITGVWNAVYGFLAGVFNTIRGVVTGAWNAIYGAISGAVSRIWGAVTGTFNSVVNFAAGIGGRILGAVGNLGSILYNSGRAMIQGLLNGAGSLIGTIGSFFLNKLPGWIQGPFKKALGINSPSKVFAGYGANISEGLANGVAKNANAVTGAVSDLADAAINGMGGKNGITADLTANMSASNPVGGTPSSSNTTNQTTIQNVYLGDASAVKQFFKELNQDTILVGSGLSPVQGANK